MKRRVDVVATNHLSLWTLQPLTHRAQNWLDEHIDNDSIWHGSAVVVEPRYVDAIVNGMREEGLVVAR